MGKKKIKKEETIDHHIKTTWHAISRMYGTLGVPHDISTTSGFVLLNIDPAKGTPATKIGPSMGLEPRSLTRILKTLLAKEWIYKEKDDKDGRVTLIKLTGIGLAKRELSKNAVIEFNDALYDRIPLEKLKIFFEVIEDINNYLTEFKAD